jgi:lipoprotein NlpD
MVKVCASLKMFLVIFLTTLAGCSQQPASLSSLEVPRLQVIDTHPVVRGETLYSIAWKYDLNVVTLARVNGISTTATIHPGQVLSLDSSSGAVPKTARVTSKVTSAKAGKTPKTVADSPARAPTGRPAPRATLVTKVPQPITARLAAAAAADSEVAGNSQRQWRWPVRGKVVEAFNIAKLRKGIKIKALARAAVRSSAPGEIVYAGNGLRGYGKLVIVKHSELLLSAYAHNDEILVREGQRVDTMQIITKLGSSGTLYFEIRKDGKPVDPASYLNQ